MQIINHEYANRKNMQIRENEEPDKCIAGWMKDRYEQEEGYERYYETYAIQAAARLGTR